MVTTCEHIVYQSLPRLYLLTFYIISTVSLIYYNHDIFEHDYLTVPVSQRHLLEEESNTWIKHRTTKASHDGVSPEQNDSFATKNHAGRWYESGVQTTFFVQGNTRYPAWWSFVSSNGSKRYNSVHIGSFCALWWW